MLNFMSEKQRIPYGRHNISDDDINAVIEVLRSDYLTQGPKIKQFEDDFASYVGSEYAVAVSNGTAALHLSSLALDVKPGDKVITTPITFAATANCIRYCGGEIVFCDIDPDTYILDIDKVRNLLETSNKFKGIIPVDFAGRPVNLQEFRELADEFGLWIIEDACHAPGGYFIDIKGNKQFCGNGNFADLAIFSFHPVKHIAAGEGGMITTNDESLYRRLLNLRTHGIQQDLEKRKYNHGIWYYELQELGYNYRLTDIQAALGSSQLLRADKGLVRRKEIVSTYHEEFKGVDFLIRYPEFDPGHAYHLYVIETKDRNGLIQYLRSKNIFAQVHYIPVHLMPYYRDLGWNDGDLPYAEQYYKNCLSLPIYPSLSNNEHLYVIEMINNFYQEVE